MEIYIVNLVVFVGYSKNIRRHNAMYRDERVARTCRFSSFSSWFSINLLLHRLYRFYNQINSIYKCVIIESNVLHRSVSYWESLSCKMFLYSLRKHKWIETQLSILCFRQRPQQVMYCDVECFDCDRWKLQTMYISNLVS